VAGWAQDFDINKPQSIAILGEPVVISRDSDNVLTSLEKSLRSPAGTLLPRSLRGTKASLPDSQASP
jgi:hypothetical protein